jgi:AcrR family transcriptional regulator
VRDGVRAVRHRAVAAEAGVPLSATTYYFKDIDDLLTDTFAQYVERSAAHGQAVGNNEGLLRDGRQGDGSPQARSQLADDIARLMADYVHRQLSTVATPDGRAGVPPGSAAQPAPGRAGALAPADPAAGHPSCFRWGSREPQQDAKVLTAIIGRMEYQGLLNDASQAEEEMLAS